jgi:hypothetical protein
MRAAAVFALALIAGCATAGTLEIDRRGDRKAARVAVLTYADAKSAEGCLAAFEGRGRVAEPADVAAVMKSSGTMFFAGLAERLQAEAVVVLKLDMFVYAPKSVSFVTAEWIDPPTGEILAVASVDGSVRDELSALEAGKNACAAFVPKKR